MLNQDLMQDLMNMNILDFLNQNAGALSVIFSCLVAIATVVYAVLTWKLVSETKQMRIDQIKPNISVTVQPTERWIGLIEMIIENTGASPAYDIRFEVDPDFEYRKGRFLSELGFVKKGIPSFAPGQRLKFFLTALTDEKKLRSSFKIKVSYKDAIGNSYENIYEIDFSILQELPQLDKSPLYEIADSLKTIESILDGIERSIDDLKGRY